MTTSPPGVAILPSGMKLGLRPGQIALDRLIWPLGQPDALKGARLRDLGPEDHLIVFPRKTLHWRPSFGTRAKVSIMIAEPEAIHGQHMQNLRRTYRRFHRVLTCNAALLEAIPNGVLYPLGSTWVPQWRSLDLTKSRMCSLIASAKRSQEGHVLRHDMADWARAEGIDMDVMGGGYKAFETKAEGLAPYRYSVVIENVREQNYFTEKLIDAILCNCVPIYWGCPNIGDFLNTDGMILCESGEDVRRAVRAMSEADFAARLPGLEQAHERAEYYGDYLGRAAHAVLDCDEGKPDPPFKAQSGSGRTRDTGFREAL